MKTVFYIVGSVVLLFAAAVFFVTNRFDGEAVRQDTVAKLDAATGKEWVIDESARLLVGRKPVVVLRGVHVLNAPWGTRPDMLTIEQVEIVGSWESVIQSGFEASVLRLANVEINLETDGDGNLNFNSNDEMSISIDDNEVPVSVPSNIPSVTVADAILRFRSGWGDVENIYSIDQIGVDSRGVDTPLGISMNAIVSGQPMAVVGELGAPSAMFSGNPFDIEINGNYAGPESAADVRVSGHIGSLEGLKDVALDVSLNAKSLNEVGSISGFALPRDTPVKMTAKIGSTETGVTLQDYVLRIGHAIIRPQDGG